MALASVRRELAETQEGPASRDLTCFVNEVLAILPQYTADVACLALVEADEDVQKAVDLLLSNSLPIPTAEIECNTLSHVEINRAPLSISVEQASSFHSYSNSSRSNELTQWPLQEQVRHEFSSAIGQEDDHMLDNYAQLNTSIAMEKLVQRPMDVIGLECDGDRPSGARTRSPSCDSSRDWFPLPVGQNGSCDWMPNDMLPMRSGFSQTSIGSGSPVGCVDTMSIPCIEVPPARCTLSNLSDHQIIEGLAASDRTHRRLLRIAQSVRFLLHNTIPVEHHQSAHVELYGSLALHGLQKNDQTAWYQNWPRHYVRVHSDIDIVVLLGDSEIVADVVRRLIDRKWTLRRESKIPKFAVTQFTLSANGDQFWLDLTFIDKLHHYKRFKYRQEAFIHTFKMIRAELECNFGQSGALAFDSYIYLLKGFGHSLPNNAMTSFQATCYGLFCLQLRLYELKCMEPTGLLLFECFLRFCCTFFDGSTNKAAMMRSYRYNALDLSLGARMLPRTSSTFPCEAYFLSCEVQMQVQPSERGNIAHSLDPAAVCRAARETLDKFATIEEGTLTWKADELPEQTQGATEFETFYEHGPLDETRK